MDMDNKKEIKRCKIALLALICLGIAFMVYYVAGSVRDYFSSDYAAYILLAREQNRLGQFFPDGFHYSTGLFIFTPNLLIAPLLYIIEDWIVCRQIAVAVYAAVLLVLARMFFCRILQEKESKTVSFLIFTVLFLMPLSFTQMEEWFFEAGYLNNMIYELMILLCFACFWEEHGSPKKMWMTGILFFGALVVGNMESSRNYLLINIPLFGALALYQLIENWEDFSTVCKNQKVNRSMVIVVAGTVSAFLLFSGISRSVGLRAGLGNAAFADSYNIAGNLDAFLNRIVLFHGASGRDEIITIKGVSNMVNFLIMTVLTVVFPLLALARYKMLDSSLLKLFVLFLWISNFLDIYMMIFCDLWSVNPARYFQTAYFNNIILASVIFTHMISVNRNGMAYLIVLVLSVSTGINQINTYTNEILPVREECRGAYIDGFIQFLEDNHLTYGYASFWNAYKYTALSSGKVNIAAFEGVPDNPYKWLTSDSYYDPNVFSGRCFILLDMNVGENVDDTYRNRAVEILQYSNYEILVFENSIYG